MRRHPKEFNLGHSLVLCDGDAALGRGICRACLATERILQIVGYTIATWRSCRFQQFAVL